MFEQIMSTTTILSPQFNQAVNSLLSDIFLLVATGVATLAGMGIRYWISKLKIGIVKTIAEKLVAFAEQKFGIDNEAKRQYVAAELSKRFPRISADEIEHILEAAVVALKNAQSKPKGEIKQ